MLSSNRVCVSARRAGLVKVLVATGLMAALGMSPASASLLINQPAGSSTTTVFATGSGGQNDVMQTAFGVTSVFGVLGGSISQAGSSELRYDILGYEAGFQNQYMSFDTPTGQFTTTAGGNTAVSYLTPIATFFTNGVNGLLNFVFNVNQLGGGGSVTNASNLANFLAGPNFPNFLSSLNPAAQADGSVVLWLDDAGGGPDRDFDDLVVRISEVPLPSSFPLFAGGLGLLGLLWLRRRKAEPMNMVGA